MRASYSCTAGLDTTLPLPVEFVCALGVKLIGLSPLFSGVETTAGVVVDGTAVVGVEAAAVPRKLATLLPTLAL